MLDAIEKAVRVKGGVKIPVGAEHCEKDYFLLCINEEQIQEVIRSFQEIKNNPPY